MRSLPTILVLLLLMSACTGREAKKEERGDRPAIVREPDSQGTSVTEIPSVKQMDPSSPGKSRKKARPAKRKAPAAGQELQREYDRSVIGRLDRLRTLQLEPDLNEPYTRRNLIAAVGTQPFPSLIELSRERYFRLQADNDLLDNTDRFYTNGIRFEYIAPALSGSPLATLMVPYWHSGINYYGMSLVQNMYTPSTTKQGGIQYGDRPYAAYLYLSAFRITNDATRLFRLSSDLQMGVIGPASLGGAVQTAFHNSVPTNDQPLGWEYQVENDLLLNYSVSVEKGLLSYRFAELNVTGNGILGTVYTGLTAGLKFRTGAMQPYFRSLGFSKRSVNLRTGMRNAQCYFFTNASGTAVGYDATLQGGLFNKTSPYTIPSDSVTRVRFNGSAGVVISYGGVSLDAEQHVVSPEYTGGLWHFWFGLGLSFSF